jgi:beta-ribofuranosylaminobenzene 5'-phosphate synthase
MSSTSPVRVEVVTPARLHLGFLDLQGGLGRRFGSLGLTIDTFATSLCAERAEAFAAQGSGAERALRYATEWAAARECPGAAHIHMRQAIPDHCGLGSGTQMALAVGTALERLYGGEPDTRGIAQALQRGARSGIGIGAFDEGGFIVDCGRGARDEQAPPIAMRLPVPEQWRALLLFDQRSLGLHGAAETAAFSDLPEFPEAAAGSVCRLVLMKLVPGLLGGDFRAFAESVHEIQRIVGKHFAPVQGGCFASPAVTETLDWLEGRGIKGSGQSSWGPTGFVLAEDDASARGLERDLKRRFGELSPLRYRIVGPRNRGATVAVVRAHRGLSLDRARESRMNSETGRVHGTKSARRKAVGGGKRNRSVLPRNER